MFLDDHGHSLSLEHGARASIGQLSHLERAMRFKGPTRFCPNNDRLRSVDSKFLKSLGHLGPED
jgi:hypothetical protein